MILVMETHFVSFGVRNELLNITETSIGFRGLERTLALKLQAVCSTETLVFTYKPTLRCSTEGKLNLHRRENLMPHTVWENLNRLRKIRRPGGWLVCTVN